MKGRWIALLCALLLARALPAAAKTSLAHARIALEASRFIYNGEPQEPAVRVTFEGASLRQGEDYELIYTRNLHAGRASVLIRGIGAYSGERRRDFEIEKAENPMAVRPVILECADEAQFVTIDAPAPGMTRRWIRTSDPALRVLMDGRIRIPAGYAGHAQVILTCAGSNDYLRGEARFPLIVRKTPRITAYSRASGMLLAQWDACPGASGYELEVQGMDGVQRFWVSADAQALLAEELLSGKVRVRARSVYLAEDLQTHSQWSDPLPLEIPRAVYFFGSDYQSGYGQLAEVNFPALLARLAGDGYQPDRVVLCGDYNGGGANYEGDATLQIGEIAEALGEAFPGFYLRERLFLVQGNHDLADGTYTPDGFCDLGPCLLYVMNTETMNPWHQGAGTEQALAVLREAAERIRRDMAPLIERGERRPVLVATHVPLHFSEWTIREGDNLFSSVLYDALAEAAEHLELFVLFGHNHAYHGDDLLGGSCIFRPKGARIALPEPLRQERKTERYRIHPLPFHYMSAGYIGHLNPDAAERTQTLSVFLCYDERMEILRYSTEGPHALGAAGVCGDACLPRTVCAEPIERWTIPLDQAP